MRKALTVAFVGVALSMTLVAEGLASASEPNVTGPTTAKNGETFEFLVRNCGPGLDDSGYPTERYISIDAYDPDGNFAGWHEQPAEVDGETAIPTTIHDPGRWAFHFYCKNQTDDFHTWGPEIMPVEVYGEGLDAPTLTAEERKRCRKKKSAKKRRACRKREAAD